MADNIKDIGTEYNDMLAAFAAGSLAPSTDKTEPTEPATTPQEPTEPTPTVETPTAITPPAVEEPKVTAPVVEDVKIDEPWTDWDATPEVANQDAPKVDVTNTTATPTFTELSKALGVEFKSEADVLAAIKAEQEKTKILDNIPSELKKAIELASKGVDYLEYLKINTVDYSKADPIQLYEDYIIDQMANEKGEVDEDKVNEYLDSLPEMDKTIKGNELKRQLLYAQSQRTAQLEQEAVRTREKHDTELKAALRSMVEVDKFKINDQHRNELFDWISSGKIMKDLFYDANGNFDAVKAAKVAFRNKYYEKLDAYQKTLIRNATKREILKDITNQDIVSTPKFANPEPTKGYGVGDYISQLEQIMSQR